MPFLRSIFAPSEKRSASRLPALTGGGTSAAVNVTPESSLQVITVYACVRIVSEAIAALPTGIFKRTPGYRTRVEGHKLADLLLKQPNPQIDSGEFWRTIVGWMMLRGNGYAYVQRNGAGRPVALWPVSPTSVTVLTDSKTGKLLYRIEHDTSKEFVPVERGTVVSSENMLHYRAFGLGVEGLSPIAMARQQVGTNWASTDYIGKFFANDASPGGVLQTQGALTDDQFDRLQESWNDAHRGTNNSHKAAILEGGVTWQQTTLSPADAQFLAIYRLSQTDIATGVFGVPAHKVGNLERATFSNIEQQSQDFITDALAHWLVRLERVTSALLGADEYLRFNLSGLLRGDTAARNAAYVQGRQWGWLSANDIRRSEDLDPIDDGDTYLQPLNMVPAGSYPEPASATPAIEPAKPAEEPPQ